MTNPVEPSADIRQASRLAREMFVGLTEAGFTERQALTIINEGISNVRLDREEDE